MATGGGVGKRRIIIICLGKSNRPRTVNEYKKKLQFNNI